RASRRASHGSRHVDLGQSRRARFRSQDRRGSAGIGAAGRGGDPRLSRQAAGADAMMLEVRELRAFYGENQALYGLDFALDEGNSVTLLGANGAGKTTTLRALCGMVRLGGEIRFDGKSLLGRATEDIVRLGIAHVPEGRGTFVRMTVEENLQLGAMVRRDRMDISRDIEQVYRH